MALRQAAGLPETVSVLRVCDAVVWMHHRTDHQQGSCREAVSGPEVRRPHTEEPHARRTAGSPAPATRPVTCAVPKCQLSL
ncbi:hypothetical protein ACFVW1_16000 [Streptomyces olivochromogenes]|uniref:hypothetical protein n=1 Tax=Streptomyces olivochromogenes TaxID=1963 RepID=UPI0036DE67A9